MLKKSAVALLISATASVHALAAGSDVLFSYGGRDYQLKDLQPRMQQSYFDTQVKARESLNQLLEQAMMEIYIEQQAEKTNRSINEVSAELFRFTPVSSTEVQAFYSQFKDQISRPLEEVEQGIRQKLEGERQQQVVQALIEKVKGETGFTSKLPEPEAPTFTMDLSPYPWKGGKNAEITVVEFADYNCGYCRTSKPEIDKVMKEYGDKVKLYYVDFPVTERGVAGSTTQTARGAYCAGQQDKFWEFQGLAYQQPVTMETAGELAKTLKLDQKKFNTCLSSDESLKFVQDSTRMASDLGVSGTPTLFVNGRRLHTHDVGKDLKVEIERRLNAG